MRRLSVVMLAIVLLVGGDTVARGRSGGFSSGRSSSFRSSRTTTRPKAAPKRAPAPRKKSSSLTKKQTTAKKSAVKPKAVAKSKTDKAMAKKNNLAAKKYGSRANAQKEFRSKLKNDPNFAKKYPNKFDKQPAKRPDYIPASVNRGGTTYNVTYMNGGYGYMGPLGTWIMLDMMTDMMVTDAMLRSHGYGTYGPSGAPMIVRTGPSGAIVFLWILGGIVGIAVIVVIIKAATEA